jgi:hypothetical protein
MNGSRWAQMSIDAVTKAAVMQSRVIAEIYQGAGPSEAPWSLGFDEFADEMDANSHRQGDPFCDCPLCQKYGPMLLQLAQQVIMQAQQGAQ